MVFRSAHSLNLDFYMRKGTYAQAKAKQMQGAGNPRIGVDIRKPGSAFCSSCGRWHRPGKTCSNAMKSKPLIWKGNKITHADVNGGNPYRGNQGQFGAHPAGPEGLSAKKEWKDSMKDVEAHCGTGPAVGPEGPEHTHEISCDNAETPNENPNQMSIPLPTTLNPQTLMTPSKKPVEEHKTFEDFRNTSNHVQTQEQKYLDNLKRWQQLYG